MSWRRGCGRWCRTGMHSQWRAQIWVFQRTSLQRSLQSPCSQPQGNQGPTTCPVSPTGSVQNTSLWTLHSPLTQTSLSPPPTFHFWTLKFIHNTQHQLHNQDSELHACVVCLPWRKWIWEALQCAWFVLHCFHVPRGSAEVGARLFWSWVVVYYGTLYMQLLTSKVYWFDSYLPCVISCI